MTRPKIFHRVVAALALLWMVLIGARIYAGHILTHEPDAERYPGWVRVMHEWGVFGDVSSLAEQKAEEERRRKRLQLLMVRTQAERPRREPPLRTPSEGARTHPLGRVLTRAAEEAGLPEVTVLGVDCAEGREGYCIAWGQGTTGNADVHALMQTPSFSEHRGPVSEWAVSAVHWESGWEGEPGFFALGIHERKNDVDLRHAFKARSRVLRVAHEAGTGTAEPLAGEGQEGH